MLKNGSIVLFGATLESLCWSRWLGMKSPVFCKSRWHWILSWESWALCHKRHSVQEGTHTNTKHIPFPLERLAIQSFCDKRPCDSMCVGCVCVCPWFFLKQLCLCALCDFSCALFRFCLFDQQKERTFVSEGFSVHSRAPISSSVPVYVYLLQLCVLSYKHVRSWFTPSRPHRDKALFSHDFATFSQISGLPLNGPDNSFSQTEAAVGSLVKRPTQSTGARRRSTNMHWTLTRVYSHTVHHQTWTYIQEHITHSRVCILKVDAHFPDDQTHTHHQRLGWEQHCLIIHEEIVHTIPHYNGLPESKCVCCICMINPLWLYFPLTRLSSSVLSCVSVCPWLC